MKRSGSGRIARRIGAYDDESADSAKSSQSESQNRPGRPILLASRAPVSDLCRQSVLTHGTETIVKRPGFAKSKKRSSLRISFGPGDSESNDGDESSDAVVVTPKKSNLSRIAIEKSAQLRARSPLVPEITQPDTGDDRPSYNKDYIAELRSSTPSTPKDLKPSTKEEEEFRALDIASKFGPKARISLEPETSAIPTEAEILEKKVGYGTLYSSGLYADQRPQARRRRLAQEQSAYDEDEDRPWASDDSDEFNTHKNEISLRPKEKYAETRLVRDDEDIAEGFDDYTEDGRIALGKKSEREAERKRRAEIAEMIKNAEGGSDNDVSDSDEDRNAAFAAAQARAGGQQSQHTHDGARTPPKIAPLPEFGEILESLRAIISEKQQRRDLIQEKLKELSEDKQRVAERRKYLQEQLQQSGEKFEKLRQEEGLPALPANATAGSRLITERGLESLATTPMATGSSASDNE